MAKTKLLRTAKTFIIPNGNKDKFVDDNSPNIVA
jgi:hypothetical protein